MTDVPILQTILHPPLGLLQRELLEGTFTGAGDLQRQRPVLPPFQDVNAYGLTWDIFTVPPGYGRRLGSPDVYEQRIVQLSTVHADRAGHQLVSEYHEFYAEGIYWLWENPGPLRVHYEIGPGVALVFFWLIVQIP
jgi:hypothetical protein